MDLMHSTPSMYYDYDAHVKGELLVIMKNSQSVNLLIFISNTLIELFNDFGSDRDGILKRPTMYFNLWRYKVVRHSEIKGRMQTEMELTLEQTQQEHPSDFIHNEDANPAGVNIIQAHGRLYTSAGNHVNEIILKLNLPDHRKLKDGGKGSGPRRQETIGDNIAQTGFENVSKLSNDLLLARGNTLRSGEDSLKLKELMELCTNFQNRVIDLEKTKTSQAQEITSLKRRVKRLEKKGGSKTHRLKRLYKVGLSRRVKSFIDEGLGKEDASKQGSIADIDVDAEINLVSNHFDADTDMFGVHELVGDEVIVETEVASKDVKLSVDKVTLAQALAALKSAKPKADKVMLQEPKHGTITTTTAATTVTAASTRPKAKGLDKSKGKMVEPEPVKKLSKKDQLMLDEELAFKLQAEEE
ncbi:hypothetical protein Tco_0438369 [Tanacetum coccineum]